MKNIKVIGYELLVIGALLLSAPATAQNNQDQWRTTSMQGSGSAYSSQVTAVGATTIQTNAGTVSDPYGSTTPTATSGPRRGFYKPGESGQSTESPIGDAMLPLLTLACVYVIYCAARVYRRKRGTVKE